MVTGTGGAPWQHNHDTCITFWNWNKKTDFPFPGQPCYQQGKIPGVKRLVFHLMPHGTMPPKANSRKNTGVGRPQQQITPLQVPWPRYHSRLITWSLSTGLLWGYILLIWPFMAFPVSITMFNTQTGVCVKSKGSIYFWKCTIVTLIRRESIRTAQYI